MRKTLFLFLVFLSVASFAQKTQNKPNIIMLYVDDWAWYGSPVAMDDDFHTSQMPVLEMPNIERLAEQGMKFRNAYGSPQCSPARVCLQTGQSSPRNGFTVTQKRANGDYYNEDKSYQYFPMVANVSATTLPQEATTIAEALKPLGYTSAHYGKWHMYSNPSEHGYDFSDGDTDNNPGNTIPKEIRKTRGEGKEKVKVSSNLPEDFTDPKLMFSITEKSLAFMEEQVKEEKPFYLQISHYAMHKGLECLPETRAKYQNLPELKAWYKRNNIDPQTISYKKDPATWMGMAENLDNCIGEVMKKMKELGIEDNTYIVMTSDNGYRHVELEVLPDKKQPLHGHKWWLWDGGIRVPMIVKGPNIGEGTVFKGNVINYDFLPTFYEWAGGDPDQLNDIDGISLKDYMEGKKPSKKFLNRSLYFHFPHNRNSLPHSAVISGNYKVMHFYDKPEIPMLFDISKDLGEVYNIAAKEPKKQEEMFTDLMGYLKSQGARLPKENPNYKPEEYKKDKKTKDRMRWGAFEGERPLEADER